MTIETAGEFFTRVRTTAEIRDLMIELPENRLQLATREALEAKYDLRVREQRKARRVAAAERAAAFEAARVYVDPQTRASLPEPRTSRPRKRHRLSSAARFFARVDGMDLSHELDGYKQFQLDQRRKEAAAVWHRWTNAPIDPISQEEYEAMTTKSLATRRVWRARRGYITPAGMSIETAERIARQALGLDG